MKMLYYIILFFLLHANYSYSQTTITEDSTMLLENTSTQNMSNIIWIMFNCKNEPLCFIKENKNELAVKEKRVFASPISNQVSNKKNWLVSGNILYNFNYRSMIDTPYQEKDFMQHITQTRLDFCFIKNFPVSLFITNKSSNSSYFVNSTDFSFQYRQEKMFQKSKKELLDFYNNQLSNPFVQYNPHNLYALSKTNNSDYLNNNNFNKIGVNKLKQPNISNIITDSIFNNKLNKLFDNYKTTLDKVSELENELKIIKNPRLVIELRELEIKDSLLNKKTTKLNLSKSKNGVVDFNELLKFKDKSVIQDEETNLQGHTLVKKIEDSLLKIKNKEKILDSLQKKLKVQEQLFVKFQKQSVDSLKNLRNKVSEITNSNQLKDYYDKNSNTDAPGLSKGFKSFLFSVREFGIGRSWLDYSELSVKNVSINGINFEANPKNFYIATAAGSINYQFRDFNIKSAILNKKQSLGLVRFGYGNKNHNNIIVTIYQGRKYNTQQVNVNDSTNVLKKISGVSIESKIELNKHIYLMAEYAKARTENNFLKIVDFNRRENEAFSIKLNGDYPLKHLNIISYYRVIGEYFQSFTLYTPNNKQESWAIKLKKSFVKNRIQVLASIKKNEFTNPLAQPDFSNSIVFKSAQVTLNFPKYPMILVGVYPTSQLTINKNSILLEQQFNTLNVVISHSYLLNKTSMNSNFVYTKFYNLEKDSAFVFFNSSTLSASHTIYSGAFSYQAIAQFLTQAEINQKNLDFITTYQYKQKLNFSGGVKMEKHGDSKINMGCMLGLGFNVNKIGLFQFQYDKSYLPNYDREIVPITFGRITFNHGF